MTETKRMVLATLLSVGVILLFTLVLRPRPSPRPPPAPAAPPAAAAVNPAPAPAPAPPIAGPTPGVEAPAGFTATASQPETQWTLETDTLHVELTNRGAALRRLVLKRYRTDVGSQEPLVLLDEFETGRLSLQVRDLNAPALSDLGRVNWEVVEAESTATRKVFRYAREDGLVFRKEIAIGAGDYLLTGSLAIENRRSDRLMALRPSIVSAAGIVPEGGTQYLTGVAAYTAQGNWSKKTGSGPSSLLDKPEEVAATDGTWRLHWVGTTNKYYAAVLVLDGEPWSNLLSFAHYEGVIDSKRFNAAREQRLAGRRELTPEEIGALRKEWASSVAAVCHLREFPVSPGESRTLAWRFFVGPKEQKTLHTYADLGLDQLYELSGNGFLFSKAIGRFLIWMMLLLESVVRNFGVAIILLTCVVRLGLFPISRKAQVSMFKMQRLTPQMKALQEKFKEDRQRLTAETMKLYKQHKVSPWGGCLPLLLQMPVFIGLWTTLLYSIELRQAPFVWWITDLSEPDRFCRLPFPVLGQTYLNLLPILMLVPMVVQSLLTPKPADPTMAQQQKMMTWMMPVMFLFMCYTIPSGVTLYWLISSLWGVAETRMIKKVWLKDGPSPSDASSAPAAAVAGGARK